MPGLGQDRMNHLQRFLAYLIILVLIRVFAPSPVWCQTDPYGVPDTVTVESRTISTGNAFSVKISLWNDEQIAGITIPLKYPSAIAVYDSVSFTHSRISQWSMLRVTQNTPGASVLLGGLAMQGAPLAAGNGVIAEIFFHTAATAQVGQNGIIDSAFIPPAGTFLLSSSQSTSISPAFNKGTLLVGTQNQAPEFDPIARKLVNEGQTLAFDVRATDPERAAVHLYGSRLPIGAKFKDNGNGSGTFSWTVPFVGPGSALGSPYAATFLATDGSLAVQMDVPIEVINVNRLPQISVSGAVTAYSGDSVFVPLVANDPDFEQITFGASNLPPGAEIHSSNPGYIIWGSDIADSGSYAWDIYATDESGGRVHRQVDLQLLPTLPAELSLPNAQAFNNELLDVPVNLRNRIGVAGFSLTIQFDPTLLRLISATRDTLRTKLWHPFTTSVSTDGKIFIDAHSVTGVPGGGPLTQGDGPVVHLKFATCTNLDLAGQFSRLEFKIIDSLSNTDNIIYELDGTILPRAEVSLISGSVLIKKYDALVGDINLNGVPMDIGDMVYYTNYFINPSGYPLTGERWANSDVNQDGNPATLGDLVLMLRIIRGDFGKVAADVAQVDCQYSFGRDAGDYVYSLNTNGDIAAALYLFRIADGKSVTCVPAGQLSGVDFKSSQTDSLMRVLVIGSQGRGFTANGQELFRLLGADNIELVRQELVDVQGREVKLTNSKDGGMLPQQYELQQNYPNPFNPETVIAFELPHAGEVAISIYNVLGEQVRKLSSGYMAAGRHRVTFDGKNDSGEPLSSGVYFYRMQSDDFSSTKKMVLLK